MGPKRGQVALPSHHTSPSPPRLIKSVQATERIPRPHKHLGSARQSPIFVRKGDHLMASLWGLHQDTDIWGADAAEFRPERWEELRSIWTSIPFLDGPRTCSAQQMMLTQEAYVLVRLVKGV